MAKLVELPNGACVDANHVIEISNPYLVKDKYLIRVSINNGMFHIFDHEKIMDADSTRLRILRHVNSARGDQAAKHDKETQS